MNDCFKGVMVSFDEATDGFSHWLISSAGVRVSPKIFVGDLRNVNQGRCVLASQDIGTDEVLFEIPRSSILNIATCQLVRDFPQLKDVFWQELGHWEGLILCMIYEIKVMGQQSFWWNYLQVLPQSQDLNTLVYWSADQLASLKPSLVVDRLGAEESQEMYRQILKYVENFGPEFQSKVGQLSFEEFVYVASVIMSYSFDVDLKGEEEEEEEEEDDDDEEDEGESNVAHDKYMKSMVPLADTLNADTKQFNAHLVYDKETLKMISVKPINMGQQVYNFYGEHPNAEILRRYGYVEWDGSQFDFGELPLSCIKQVLQREVPEELIEMCLQLLQNDDTILEHLDQEQIVLESYDCFFDGQVIPECLLLLQVLTVILQIPNVGDNLARELQRVVKKCLQLVESGRLTIKCLRLFEHCVDERLRQYPNHSFREVTPIHQYVHDVDAQRGIMAQRVLQSEVESLQNCYLSLGEKVQIIDDIKLMDNILKKRTAPTQKTKKETKRKRTH